MSDNEKITHSSDETGAENTAGKVKDTGFSIDSILAEYAVTPKAANPSASVAPGSKLKDILGADAGLKSLMNEIGEKETPETIVEQAQEESANIQDSDSTVVFGVTGDIDIPESKSMKELFDTIETLTRINTGDLDIVKEPEGERADPVAEIITQVPEDADVVIYPATEEMDAVEEKPQIRTADEAETPAEEFTATGIPLPTAQEQEEAPKVNLDELYGDESQRDPLFASENGVGFDEFESGEGTDSSASGVTPETEAFDSVKNGDVSEVQEGSETDGKLKTLFGGTTGSTPVVGADGKVVGKKKKVKKQPESHRADEVDFSSEQGINRSLGNLFRKTRFGLLSVIGTGFFLILSLLYTVSSQFFPVSEYFAPGAYSSVFILVDLQIMLFAAMCALDKLIRGAVDFYDGYGSPECVSLVTTLIITVYSVFGAVYAGGREEVYIFGAIGCLGLFLVSLYDYYKSTCDYQAFRIAASPTSKYGSVELDPTGNDCAPFSSYITAGSKAFTIQKGEKYLNFSRRNEVTPKCERGFGVNCVVSFVLALIVGAVVFVLSELDLYIAATAAIVVYCSSVPFGTYIAVSLPRYILSGKASKHNCAIIGGNVHEEYENVSVISFEDTEVFPPKDVRVSSIRTYGNTPLDSAIMDIAFISKKLSGPLSTVFSKAVTYSQSDIDGVEILEVYPDAIKAAIGNNEYLLATSAFLRANGLTCYEDSVDASYINSLGSILFMVKNNETIAKFYIKYSINPQFENILSGLNNADICVSVRTVDPCINNDLLLSGLRNKNCLISVVKGEGVESIPSTSKNIDSGIISITGIHNFLKMYILCDRLGRTVKINSIVKTMGMIFGFVIPIALFALNFANPAGTVNVVNSLFVLLMQFFWIIPIAIISRLYR